MSKLLPMRALATGRWTKLGIFGQVLAILLLAACAAVLATWLSARQGLRARVDLTALQTNTLDPSLGDLIAKMPERVTIDVFFRPQPQPFTSASLEAQARTADLLVVARSQFPEKLRVVFHDLSDVASASARMRELDVEEDNLVVVQLGKRRAVLKLWRDLARLKPGNPQLHLEPSVESFRGEQALANALLEVSIAESPQILFTTGHGERDLADAEKPGGCGRMRSALIADGFRAGTWDSSKDAKLPADARVVALVDPKQPLRPEEFDELVRFVDGGGRLLVVPSSDDAVFGKKSGAEDLLKHYGIVAAGGFVAAPYPDRFGRLNDGDERCSIIWIDPSGFDEGHPATESLRHNKRTAVFVKSRVFARGPTLPKNSLFPDLVVTPTQTWRDLSTATQPPDWHWDEKIERDVGPFAVCLAGVFPAPTPPAASTSENASEPEKAAAVSKIIALGSADVLANAQLDTNRDLALNLFNWLASRDQRLVVRPRVIDRRELDWRQRPNVIALLGTCVFGLPALCMLLGVFVAWRRRK